MPPLPVAPPILQALQGSIQGTVSVPGTPAYEAARATWNTTTTHYPALIVEARHSADVPVAIQFARQQGLRVAVQATGHGLLPACDGQLLLKTTALKCVDSPEGADWAWVEAGVLWPEVLQVTQPRGLAPLMGFTGTVGVVGFTLNGGLGWLSRQYGLAADHLLAIRLVTMDGQERLVSPDSHPDLFWALCGNGPSIGVVTAIQVKLHPVTEVVAGKFYFPADRAAEVLEAYRGWTATWPDTLTSVINVVTLPPYEDIPEPIRGQSVLELALCVTDSLAAAQALLAPIEQLQPLLQFATLRPYSALLGFSNDPQEPTKLAGYHLLFDELSPEAMMALATQIVANPALPSLILELRHLGGAIATTPSRYASFCHRQTRYLLHIIAQLDPQESPTSGAARIAALRNAMAPYASGNTLKSFLYRSDDAQRVTASYTPDTLAALVRIRQQYDPHQRQLTVLPQEADPIATAPDPSQRALQGKN